MHTKNKWENIKSKDFSHKIINEINNLLIETINEVAQEIIRNQKQNN